MTTRYVVAWTAASDLIVGAHQRTRAGGAAPASRRGDGSSCRGTRRDAVAMDDAVVLTGESSISIKGGHYESTSYHGGPLARRRRARRALAVTVGVTLRHHGSRRFGHSTPPTQSMKPQTSIGKGEGKLNLIAWAGYAQPEWVKPFETATGCVVNAKYANTSGEMVSLMANGGGGQYDLVSASGDADLRLIYGGDVKPVNMKLIPSWKEFRPFLQSPDFNTINGVHYGVSLAVRPQRAALLDQDLQDAADVLERDLLQEVQGQDHDPRQPDPDRRRGALPVSRPSRHSASPTPTS